MATGIYSGLTPEDIVSLSYWTAVNGWGISSNDYPQSYLPGACGCILVEVATSLPPQGIPDISASFMDVASCKFSPFTPQYFEESLQTYLNYDLV